jgi:uncharacterized protein DUF6134
VITRTLGLVILLVAVALALPVHADPTVYQYRVEHPTFGDIGTYTNSIEQTGDHTHVETSLHVLVRLLGMVVYRQDATRSEDWREGRLTAFHGVTSTNGDPIEVTGTAVGDRFVITSPAGVAQVAAEVHPSNPWSAHVLRSNLMMSTKTGKVYDVRVSGGEEMPITLDGAVYRLRQYVIDGLHRDMVWLDDRGVPVAFRTDENGKPVDFVLENPSPAAGLGRPEAAR